MKLIPFSSQFLRPDKPLPFGLRDQTGRLLLAAGERIETAQQYQLMREQSLFALEAESSEWMRKLQLAMEGMIRQGATLSQVAAVEPDLEKREAAKALPKTLPEQWQQLAGQLDTALRDTRPGSDGLARVRALRHCAKALLQRQPDAALYLSIYEAGHSTAKYSSHHGLLTMQICELAGPLLGWGADRVDTLCLAALSMNLGMHKLQDLLAAGDLDLTPSMRAQIDRHPQLSADMLAAAGVDDALWLEVVRLHHDARGGEQPLAELPPARQLARLLRRVDIFTAKLSRRAKRVPMSPVQAAREACLGASGQPDEIGGALIKAVGLYPPGSFVELASGEVGIVVARGRRANLPLVGTLVGSTGAVLMQPILRDTTESRHTVKAAVASSAVNVRPQHDKLLALR